MDKDFDFSAVSLKRSVAVRFRIFSKKIAPSHSETLSVMMDFFENNSLSPHDDVGPNMIHLEKNLKSRINGLIAIIRDIEKNQTKPTVAMLHLLFEQAEPKKKPLILENNNFRADVPKAPESYNKDRT